MAAEELSAFIRQLRRLVDPQQAGGLTDGDLLERFVTQRDEAAFEVLLWRHGPMVLSVCQRLLSGRADVEDAFQAVFLVLVRKAAAIRKRPALGSWLYKVAYRVALRVRTEAAGRAASNQPDVETLTIEPADDVLWRDLRPVLDDEVRRLPERYRLPFVLCYLQGRTNEETARELGCPVGTVHSRLAWARERLRSRLTRRGVTLTAVALAAVLSEKAAAALPAAMADSTIKAVALFAAGKTAAGALSAHSATLARGVLKAMFYAKVKVAAAVVLCLVLLGVGVVVATQQALAKAPADPKNERVTAPAGADENKDLVEVASPRDGIVVLIGTEIKEGEKVPPRQLVEVKVGDEVKKYRRLAVGDTVEKGQLLARLDARLARDEVAARKAKLEAKQAALAAAMKTRDEAQERYKTLDKLRQSGARVTSDEEFRAAKLTLERYTFEVAEKEADVKVAHLELSQAQTILEMHEIRSPCRGVIKKIYKQPGEGAKALEAVMQIQVVEER